MTINIADMTEVQMTQVVKDLKDNLTRMMQRSSIYRFDIKIDNFFESGSKEELVELAVMYQDGRVSSSTLSVLFHLYCEDGIPLREQLRFRRVFPLMNRTFGCVSSDLYSTILRVGYRIGEFETTGKVRGWDVNLFSELSTFNKAIEFELPNIDDCLLLREYISYLHHEQGLEERHMGARILASFGLSSCVANFPSLEMYEGFSRYNKNCIANVCVCIEDNYKRKDWNFIFVSAMTDLCTFSAYCINPSLITTWISNRRLHCDIDRCSGCRNKIIKAIDYLANHNSNVIKFYIGSWSELYPASISIGWTDTNTGVFTKESDVTPILFEEPTSFIAMCEAMTEKTWINSDLVQRAERIRKEKEEKKAIRQYRKQEKQLKRLFLAAIRSMGETSHPAGITKNTLEKILTAIIRKRNEYLGNKSFSKDGQRATSFELELTNAKKVSEFLMLEHLVQALGGDVVRDGSVTATERADKWEWECIGRPLPKEEYDNFLHIFCSALQLVGAKSNDTCGLHIHVDASDFEDKNLRRMVKIWRTVEEAMFALCAEHRQDNRYAQWVKRTLNKCLKTGESFGKLFYGSAYNFSDAIESHYMNERYYAINFHSFFYHDRKSIEFRLKEATTNEFEIRCWTDICRILVESAKSLSKEEVHQFSQEQDSFKALMTLIGHDMNLVRYVNDTWKKNNKIIEKDEIIGTIIDSLVEAGWEETTPVNNTYSSANHEPEDDYDDYDPSLEEVEEELVEAVRSGQAAIRRSELMYDNGAEDVLSLTDEGESVVDGITGEVVLRQNPQPYFMIYERTTLEEVRLTMSDPLPGRTWVCDCNNGEVTNLRSITFVELLSLPWVTSPLATRYRIYSNANGHVMGSTLECPPNGCVWTVNSIGTRMAQDVEPVAYWMQNIGIRAHEIASFNNIPF